MIFNPDVIAKVKAYNLLPSGDVNLVSSLQGELGYSVELNYMKINLNALSFNSSSIINVNTGDVASHYKLLLSSAQCIQSNVACLEGSLENKLAWLKVYLESQIAVGAQAVAAPFAIASSKDAYYVVNVAGWMQSTFYINSKSGHVDFLVVVPDYDYISIQLGFQIPWGILTYLKT